MTVLGKYLLFQVPSWLLASVLLWLAHRSLGLEAWIAWTLLAGYVVKDLVLYPWMRAAYDGSPSRHVGPDALVGAIGRVEERMAPRGYVSVAGERWRAVAVGLGEEDDALEVGAEVRVCAVDGLVLSVACVDVREPELVAAAHSS